MGQRMDNNFRESLSTNDFKKGLFLLSYNDLIIFLQKIHYNLPCKICDDLCNSSDSSLSNSSSSESGSSESSFSDYDDTVEPKYPLKSNFDKFKSVSKTSKAEPDYDINQIFEEVGFFFYFL